MMMMGWWEGAFNDDNNDDDDNDDDDDDDNDDDDDDDNDDDDGVMGGCSNLWSNVGPPWGEEGSTPPPSHPSLTGDNDHNDRAHDEDDSIDDYDGDGHWQNIRKGCILRKRV